jgi:hypothetical protein
MKKNLLILVVFIGFSFGFTKATDNEKHPIVGTWEYVSAKINGVDDARSATINRTQHFFADQSFEGRFTVNDGEPQLYNNGKYFMANDTTLVTIQNDLSGKLSQFSNVFIVKISNDTMHQYGFFIRPVSQTTIVPVFLEEYWVKKKAH